jgi:thiosulfate/3-mercaptopyruvate sulfurtransferase
MNTVSFANEYATDTALADPAWLEACLYDSSVRVVEVDVSQAAYDQWHIEGAVLWNVYADLKDADYGLIEPAAMERLLSRSGIGQDTTVVFYGYAPALGLWLMKLYRHANVRILNCSRDTWRAEGRACTAAVTEPAPARYPLGQPDARVRAGQAAVQAAIGDPGASILDVRTWDEYRGERFWPSGGMEPGGRAGHIPTAVHEPPDGLYDERGAFRPATDLRGIFAGAGPDGDRDLITYCTIGGRASTAWFVLTYLLGYRRVRVYDGSWAEWGRLADTPVERS